MPDADYYKVLEVSREATADEIRKAYRRLSRQYHPDVNPNDDQASEKFKQVQEAYSILGDAEKREQYDRYGAAFQGAGQAPHSRTSTWTSGPGGAGPIDLEQIFGGQFGGQIDLGDLFGGFGPTGGGKAGSRGQAVRPRRGRDLRSQIDVPFLVAAEGGKQDLFVQRNEKSERLTVTIPAGVGEGSVIRLSGQGESGENGGPAGDLLLTVNVSPHPWFRREKNNLLIDVPVSPSEAALGAKVEVPTLDGGRVVVTVPSGTSSGTRLRLRGKGIPDRKTKSRGDLFIVVEIVVPKSLSPEARELFERLAQQAPLNPREGKW